MTEKELKIRTRRFAMDVLTFADPLLNLGYGNIMGNQSGQCAFCLAANYRAACQGRSPAELIAMIGIVDEEVDESTFWLDMIPAAKYASRRTG